MGEFIFFLKKHWRNAVYSNVWIALGAAATTWQTIWLLQLEVAWHYALFVGFATLATYNFQRLVKFQDRPEYLAPGRNNWLFRNRSKITIITLFAAIGMLFTTFKIPTSAFPLLAVMAMISLFYVVRFIPFKGKKRALRDLPFLKVYVIALVWTVVSVLIPIAGNDFASVVWDERIGLMLFEKFTFLVAITIPFDIRDVHLDDPHQKTTPQLVGIHNAQLIASVFACLSFLASAGAFIAGWYSLPTLIAFALSAALNLHLINRSTPERSEMFYAGAIDGTLLFQLLLVGLSLVERYI